MKILQAAVSLCGGRFAVKLRHARRTTVAHAPASRAVSSQSPTLRCFTAHAQQPPSSSSSDDDTTKSSKVNKEGALRDANEDGDSNSSNPWRHFQAFSGMDEYMDVTLIHYENKNKGESGAVTEKEPNDPSHTRRATQK